MAYQASEVLTPLPARAVPESGLVDLYYRWFEVVRCTTPELVEAAQRLRYQVYCLETGFEDPAANPGGLERDAADAHALHSLLVHKPTGMVAGTVRLILPQHGESLAAMQISPILQALEASLGETARFAEISRFAISRDFRKRCADGLYTAPFAGDPNDDAGRRALPTITLGLMRAIFLMGREAEVTHLAAVIEPALERLLMRLGICFVRTGERVAYHGTRIPVHAPVAALAGDIWRRRPEIGLAITGSA